MSILLFRLVDLDSWSHLHTSRKSVMGDVSIDDLGVLFDFFVFVAIYHVHHFEDVEKWSDEHEE